MYTFVGCLWVARPLRQLAPQGDRLPQAVSVCCLPFPRNEITGSKCANGRDPGVFVTCWVSLGRHSSPSLCGQGLFSGCGFAFTFAAAGVFEGHVCNFYFT